MLLKDRHDRILRLKHSEKETRIELRELMKGNGARVIRGYRISSGPCYGVHVAL
jgi:hypothetical protein